MKNNVKKALITGAAFTVVFIVWTVLVQTADVGALGVNETDIGFSTVNIWFHKLTGTNMKLYNITDWMGLVPVFVCMIFAVTGFVQMIKRRSIFNVDKDIIITGAYYIIVILCYILFEMYPVNYRPVLINGISEASYPSSTTLLVLCVMPTLTFLSGRRINKNIMKKAIEFFSVLFSVFMVAGRLVSGVHWLSDIAGSIFLCLGLYNLYKAVILFTDAQTKEV